MPMPALLGRRARAVGAASGAALALLFAFTAAAADAPAQREAPAPSITVESAAPLAGAALRDALRRGGYVLYMRHAATDFGQNDDAMTSFDDCSKQRNLTDAGRGEAREVGEAIARLKIPIGAVLASPYCRTLETARLVFGRATASNDVRGGPANPPDAERYVRLRALLSTTPPPGANDVIVSHGNPFFAVAGAPYLAEGEIAVVAPCGTRGFVVVARIPKDGWTALVR